MADPDITPEKKPMMTFGADGGLVDPTAAPPKKVVRTYASDLATLSGKPQPAVPPPAPAKVETPPAPKPAPAPSPKPVEPPAPKEPITIPMQDAVRAYIPSEPAPAPAWTPPPQPVERFSVDRELTTVASYTPTKPLPPAPTPTFERIVEKKEPGFFARLFASWFAPKPADPMEGKILTSTVVRRSEPPPAPVPPPPPPVAPPPAPQPGPPVPLPLTPEQARELEPVAPPAGDQERDAVLARLRARVAAREGEAPPPVFPSARPERIDAAPRYQGPPPNLPGAPSDALPRAPEPLQTYTGDFAKRIDSERASTFAVLAADADRRRGEPTRPVSSLPKQPGLLYVVISTILVVGGSTMLFLIYSYIKEGQSVLPLYTPASSLIAADEEVTVRKEDGDPFRLFRDAAMAPQANGHIRVITYSIATTTATGVVDVRQSGTSFLSAMRLRAPDMLTRSVRSESTVGSVGANGQSYPFFILSTASYERSFSGMLAWESTIAQDLGILYPSYEEAIPVLDPSATSTPVVATTTRPVSTTFETRSFRDEIVESYDVRVLRDAQGRSIMLYGYRDPNTLIIVRDEAAFAAVLTRFTGTARD